MSTILHIATRGDWDAARAAGRYEAASLRAQGFIHCSRPEQVVAVANALFRGRDDLILLCIDEEKVTAEVRDENLEGGEQRFPHVYGPLNLDAVGDIRPFAPGPDGLFTLPADLRAE